LFPKNGSSFDFNGIWDGVLGKVVKGDAVLSLSEWKHFKERNDILDHVPVSSTQFVLALTPK